MAVALAPVALPAVAQAQAYIPSQPQYAQPQGQQMQQQAQGPGPSCMQLEGALAQLDRGVDPAAQQRAQQAQQMRAQLDQLTSQAKGMNCDAPRGFFIFQGPPRPPQCDQVDDQISRLRASIASLDRANGDKDGQRRQLIVALAQNNCGAQYTAAARNIVGPQGRTQQAARPRNFFEALFGGGNEPGPDESGPGADFGPMDLPKSSTYRTVCVRTCDGFYFPISYATVPAKFASDDALCHRLCPAAEAQLYTYRNPGEDIQQATSVTGKPYMSLPAALLYRKQLVNGCSCRAAGQSWGQALAGLDDQSTLEKGDILVTEEQAKAMSQPRAVGDAAKPQRNTASRSGAAPAPGQLDTSSATESAPLAPAAEQPGRRAVRVVPSTGGEAQ
ncbi:hypothetical protein GCM10007301_35390 [Azorhizobium oxalatiphilum]|uniref:DUF2865 domain-containing protein n=1 Tax=Azorhizobium oxalatiphilum TaxID=980631 RepID=A0A917FE25_9HYPH|nr:DUF2865 domain-containing protein [Azorhizobium oxalatiphilum]GGF72476.1 hypothetical protein GCM10007301_35390 [Azorhizobium oxalatiphilum]